jgi:hypothetical protein
MDGFFRKAFEGLPRISRLNDMIRSAVYRYPRKMDDPVEENLLLRDRKVEVVDAPEGPFPSTKEHKH